MEKIRNFQAINIPRELWFYKELSLLEKLFLIEINELNGENGCYATNRYFSKFFGLSTIRCSQILGKLKEKNFIAISVERKGKIVAKRNIKLLKKSLTRLLKKSLKNTNTRDIRSIYPPITNKERKKTKEILSDLLAKRVISYLNKKTHCNFKPNTGEYKRNISGRAAQGYAFKDFKYVIDIKCSEWKDTEFAKHLTPSTLFRASNFGNYRNQRIKENKASDNRKYRLISIPRPDGKGSIVRKVFEDEPGYKEL